MTASRKNEQIALTSQVRYRAVDDDGVLVHLENGRVIVVNEVGLFIVRQLGSSRTRQELTRAVAEAFDVSVEQAAKDLERYLGELEKEQIIQYQK